MQRLQAEHTAKLQIISNFQLGGPENLTGADDPRHDLQENEGLADLWYTDGGDIHCHPILVPSCLQELDDANEKVGAERNPQKTEVIYVADLDAGPLEWKTDVVRLLASVSAVDAGSNTLRVAVGTGQFIADRLLAKADVVRAKHERAQLCQDSRICSSS